MVNNYSIIVEDERKIVNVNIPFGDNMMCNITCEIIDNTYKKMMYEWNLINKYSIVDEDDKVSVYNSNDELIRSYDKEKFNNIQFFCSLDIDNYQVGIYIRDYKLSFTFIQTKDCDMWVMTADGLGFTCLSYNKGVKIGNILVNV